MQTIEQQAAASSSSSQKQRPGWTSHPSVKATSSPKGEIPSEYTAEDEAGRWFYIPPARLAATAIKDPEPLPPLVGEPWASRSRALDKRLDEAFDKFMQNSLNRQKAAVEKAAAQKNAGGH